MKRCFITLSVLFAEGWIMIMNLTRAIKNKIKNNKYTLYIWTCMRNIRNLEFMKKVIAIMYDPNVLFIHHNGPLYPGKLLYYIECEDEKSGFCAIYRNTLAAFNFAEQFGGVPVIRWGRMAYHEPSMDAVTSNIFEYYFQQPAGITLDEVSKASNVVSRSSNDVRFLRKDYSQINDYYEWNQEYFQELAEMQKQIHFKKDVEERMTADIGSVGLDGRTIGVHIRRIMFKNNLRNHPIAVELDDYVSAVKELLKTGKYDKVFLATEETDSLARMEQEFGEKLIYYKDICRNNIGDTFRTAISERERHHYLLGYEILRDIHTLARCQALVAGLSNVSFCAKIIKLSKDEDYLDEIVLDKGIARAGVRLDKFAKHWEKKLKLRRN